MGDLWGSEYTLRISSKESNESKRIRRLTDTHLLHGALDAFEIRHILQTFSRRNTPNMNITLKP